MNKKLTAVLAATTMVGAIGFTSIASADYDLYGSLRAGAVYSDSGKQGAESVWDFGATGQDGSFGGQGLYSRVGVKGSTDLGNGSSAGLHFERELNGDKFEARHTNVWVNAGWGKLTLGNQNNPYRNARNWDQTWFMGGQFGNSGSRYEGIKYSSNLSGPFQFSIMATGNDNTDNISEEVAGSAAVIMGCTATDIDETSGNAVAIAGCAELVAGTATLPYVAAVEEVEAVTEAEAVLDAAGNEVTPAVLAVTAVTAVVESGARYQAAPAGLPTPAVEAPNSVDRWVWAASLDLGGVALNLAYDAPQADDTGYNNTAFGVNGSAGSFGWYVAYETASDNSSAGDDISSLGGFVSLGLSPGDSLYFYHVSHSLDVSEDKDETVLGYSHSLGAGTTFIAEYLTTDNGAVEPSVLALVLKVDF